MNTNVSATEARRTIREMRRELRRLETLINDLAIGRDDVAAAIDAEEALSIIDGDSAILGDFFRLNELLDH